MIALDEFERDAGDGGSGAMFDGQDDAILAVAAQIEVGIAPGVEFRRSAQGLTGADGAGSLSGVVNEDNSDGVTALQLAQEGEQRGDIAADIFVDAMQTDERIEHQQPWLEPGDGFVETRAVSFEIEARNVSTTLIQPGSQFRLDSLRSEPSQKTAQVASKNPPGDLWTTQERALTTTPQAPHQTILDSIF